MLIIVVNAIALDLDMLLQVASLLLASGMFARFCQKEKQFKFSVIVLTKYEINVNLDVNLDVFLLRRELAAASGWVQA